MSALTTGAGAVCCVHRCCWCERLTWHEVAGHPWHPQPATPLDAAYSAGFATATLPQVWDTYSTFDSRRWHYLLATELAAPFTVHTSDLGTYSTMASFMAFNGLNDTQRVQFSPQAPLTLRTATQTSVNDAPT